jgi:putative FmdB family regulatory protein
VPIYDFVCDRCGPFEHRRDPASAGAPLRCGGCGAAARRVYGAPMVRSPGNPFSSATRDVRSRVERAHTGEPVVSYGSPGSGTQVKQAMHELKHGHHHHRPRQPWLIGH